MFKCVGGLSYLIVTAVMGAFYIIGRIIYSMGYLTRKGRLVGEAIQLSAFFGILVMAFFSVAGIYT